MFRGGIIKAQIRGWLKFQLGASQKLAFWDGVGIYQQDFNSCSNWNEIYTSWQEAADIVVKNQYPEYFVNIFNNTLSSNCWSKEKKNIDTTERSWFKVFLNLEYCGKVLGDFEFKMEKLLPSIIVYFTPTKLKNSLPNLKRSQLFSLQSIVVYKSTCAASDRAYIGQTAGHLLVRIQEHEAENTTMSTHFKGCTGVVTLDDADFGFYDQQQTSDHHGSALHSLSETWAKH